MTVDWRTLVKDLNGYTAAGEAIVIVNRKHLSLGKLRNGRFDWSLDGLAFAESYVPKDSEPASPVAPSALPVRSGAKRRTKAETEVDAKAGDSKL